MKKNIVKSVLTILLSAVLCLGVAAPSFALPYNSEMTSSYIYNYDGNAVEAPLAYKVDRVYSMADLGVPAGGLFQPIDLYYRNGYLYLVDKGGNRVFVYDKDMKLVSTIKTLRDSENYKIPALNMSYVDADGNIVYDTDMTNSDKYSLNAPEGIFVTQDDMLYIADTENRRIVICDKDGYVSNVIQHVDISIVDNFVFRPSKITVDTTGSMQVIVKAVNRGLVELDSDGSFRTFLGAPKVTVSASDWFWRSIASEEQKKKLITFVPTEYSNIAKDDRGFLYATISALDASTIANVAAGTASATSNQPIAKLTAEGTDILKRLGQFAPVGDIIFNEDAAPKIIDCAVDTENNLYSLLDESTGRFFTYNQSGQLLFVGGGSSSNQFGCVKTASSIVTSGSKIYVSDYGNKTITTYAMTDYAKLICSAIAASANGEFSLAADVWRQIVTYNSNLYIAYESIGKAEMRAAASIDDETRLEHYERALEYFALANEKSNYSKAFEQLRTEKMSKYFGWIMGGILLAAAGIAVFVIVKKIRKKKEESVKHRDRDLIKNEKKGAKRK